MQKNTFIRDIWKKFFEVIPFYQQVGFENYLLAVPSFFTAKPHHETMSLSISKKYRTQSLDIIIHD
ncbi:hypothetical protein MHH93_23085 [Priestia sp. FSL H7-0729]